MNTIEWHIRAARQLRKLPVADQQRIAESVTNKLGRFPQCSDVKALVNHQYGYRLRVGHFRVFFDFDGSIRVALVQEVKKRDSRTY